jgi:CheY-like chemotaxis protein
MKQNTEIRESLRLLIIDDDEDSAELIKNLIGRNDHRFTFSSATDKENATMAIVKDNPDCILLDYMLPGIKRT